MINKSIEFTGRSSSINTLFNRNKETVEDMLVRKLKLKYIDRNMAFAEDAWALQNRPDDQSIMSKSQLSFMKTVNLKSPTTVIEKYPNSKFKSNRVTFGSSPFGSSLPHIKGTGTDDTRNDLLR